MNNDKRDQLIKLFESLFAISFITQEKDKALIELIQRSLEIVALIGEQSAQVLSIGKSLSVLPKINHKKSLEENLSFNIKQVEQDLEEDLRGFSSLLDLVLEEYTLTVNTEEIKNNFPAKYNSLAVIFSELQDQFEALNSFYLAFGPSSGEALTILFLHALERTLRVILPNEENNAQQILEAFLDNFVRNPSLKAIFTARLNYQNLKSVVLFCQQENNLAKEILIIFLCILSAEKTILEKESAKLLDEALYEADLFGIAPFIESGFVIINDEKAYEDNGASQLRIL